MPPMQMQTPMQCNNPDVQEEGGEGGVCECLSSYHEQADRTCVPPLAPALPRVAAGEAAAGAGAAGSVIADVICVLALAVLSVLGVLFVRYVHYLSIADLTVIVQNKYFTVFFA